MSRSDIPTWRWARAAAFGAIWVHPVVGMAAFGLGTVVGCEPFMPDGAPKEFGAQGGSNAVGIVFNIYLLTLGIAPLVVSHVGAALGITVSLIWHAVKHGR